ncbi:TonB family protein [Thermosulfuriphilus sp.]
MMALEPERKDHRLLWGLIFLSGLIHLLVLLLWSPPTAKSPEEYIEIDLAPASPVTGRLLAPPSLTKALNVPLKAPSAPPAPAIPNFEKIPTIPEIAPKDQISLKDIDLNPLFPLKDGPGSTSPKKRNSLNNLKKNGNFRGYLALIRSRIEAHKRYPWSSRTRGEEGRVKVLFVISTEGRLLSLRLLESSGYKLLDEAALRAIKKAAPFPPPPPPYNQGPLKLSLSLNFQLR